MLDFEQEQNCTLPGLLPVNAGAAHIWIQNLVTFTGKRFLPSSVGSFLTGDNDNKPCTLTFPEEELPAYKMLFAMMEGQAPDKISVQDLQSILKTGSYIMASRLLEGMPAYLSSLSEVMTMPDVRTHLLACMRGQHIPHHTHPSASSAMHKGACGWHGVVRRAGTV